MLAPEAKCAKSYLFCLARLNNLQPVPATKSANHNKEYNTGIDQKNRENNINQKLTRKPFERHKISKHNVAQICLLLQRYS